MIIRLKPIAITKVWGGKKLSTKYNVQMENIGEIWGISAHISNSNIILNSPYKGMTFRDFYKNYREFFGNYQNEEFPLLFKIIDANEDLSIQVHPDDKYATKKGNSYGKDECWYILEASDNARIQIGHNAKSKEEMLNILETGLTDRVLKYLKVSKDNYFYIPSGKVHAICKDTTLLEVSQSSDLTYRLHDYNRLDNGKLRQLHINEALEVLSVPDSDLRLLHENKHFSFEILDCDNIEMNSAIFGDYIFVIEGQGQVNEQNINEGDFFVVTSLSRYRFKGKFKIALIRIINN